MSNEGTLHALQITLQYQDKITTAGILQLQKPCGDLCCIVHVEAYELFTQVNN